MALRAVGRCGAPKLPSARIGRNSGCWSTLGIDSVDRALALWTVSGDLEAWKPGSRRADPVLFRARQRIALLALKRGAARWG